MHGQQGKNQRREEGKKIKGTSKSTQLGTERKSF